MRHPRLSALLAAAALLPGCMDDPSSPPLEEDRSVYDSDGDEVLRIELTVDDLAGLAAVEANEDGAEVAVRFTEGAFSADGTLEIRGRSVRLSDQKSFKVHLAKEGGLWKGQREINLNKHPFDLTRVRNRVAFSLFQSVPDFTSLRTQFVELIINGEKRGLYTWIEEPDKRFLTSHGLDPEGTLYKAEFFTFGPIDPAVAADKAALDLVVDAKANGDPDKIAAMARDVNDPNLDIDDVIATHFNRENYLTWRAVNLLLGNFDTNESNYYLYSPSDSTAWYFMPWDYDGSLGFYESPRQHGRPRWRHGLANWWGETLHRRFAEKPENVAELEAKMAELRNGALSDERIAELLTRFRGTVRNHVSVKPDLWGMPVIRGTTEASEIMRQWEDEYDRVFEVVAGFEAEYDEVQEWPMPPLLFWVAPGDELLFQWYPSVDFQGDSVTYDWELSSSPEFEPEAMLDSAYDMTDTFLFKAPPPTGTYYWRVTARDGKSPEQNWQIPLWNYLVLEVE